MLHINDSCGHAAWPSQAHCCLPASQAAYELFNQAVEELPAGPLHLVALSGVPVIFPKASGTAWRKPPLKGRPCLVVQK